MIIENIKKQKAIIFTDDFKIAYYVFQALYGDLAKLLTVLIISLIFGFTIEFLIIVIAFAGLRTLSGGFHAQTYENCFIITVGIYLIISIITKIVIENLYISNITLLTATAIIITLAILYSPKFQIEMTKEKLKKFKVFSIIYIMVCYLLTFILSKLIYISIYVGIILQVITITPIGYNFFNWIDKNIKIKNKGESHNV